MLNIPKYLIIHHSGVSYDANSAQFEATNEYHKTKFNMVSSLGFYCGYHYEISKDGKVKQARLDSDEGCHCLGYNTKSIGICLDGNFDVELPTPEQEQVLALLLKNLAVKYGIPLSNIGPHRQFQPNRTCYGTRLPTAWARELVQISFYQQIVILLKQAISLFKK